MSKAAREYHLIDLAVGISHGGFETLAGARNSPVRRACRRGTSSTEMIGSNTTISMTGRSDVKVKQDLWMCLLLHAPSHYPPS
jgi:dipeptidyl aminopeptidase/acylaminoacyl peptidase